MASTDDGNANSVGANRALQLHTEPPMFLMSMLHACVARYQHVPDPRAFNLDFRIVPPATRPEVLFNTLLAQPHTAKDLTICVTVKKATVLDGAQTFQEADIGADRSVLVSFVRTAVIHHLTANPLDARVLTGDLRHSRHSGRAAPVSRDGAYLSDLSLAHYTTCRSNHSLRAAAPALPLTTRPGVPLGVPVWRTVRASPSKLVNEKLMGSP